MKMTNFNFLNSFRRHFSSCGYLFGRSKNDNAVNNKVVSVLLAYDNAIENKSKILKENKDKTGVYRWTNLIYDKTYVGSGNDSRRRF